MTAGGSASPISQSSEKSGNSMDGIATSAAATEARKDSVGPEARDTLRRLIFNRDCARGADGCWTSDIVVGSGVE